MGLFGGKRSAPAPTRVGGMCTSIRGQLASADELRSECAKMERAFREQTLEAAEAIWLRRLDLGYYMPRHTELDDISSFYLDAYPVLAALILHLSGRPVTDTTLARHCANEALTRVPRDNEQALKAAQNCRELLAEIR